MKASVSPELRMKRDDFGRTRRNRNRHHVVNLDVPEPVVQHTQEAANPGRLVIRSAILQEMGDSCNPDASGGNST